MPGWCVLKWERAAGSLSWMPSLLKPLFVSGRVRCSLCCWAADGFCARFWGKYQKPINYKTYKWLIKGGCSKQEPGRGSEPARPRFCSSSQQGARVVRLPPPPASRATPLLVAGCGGTRPRRATSPEPQAHVHGLADRDARQAPTEVPLQPPPRLHLTVARTAGSAGSLVKSVQPYLRSGHLLSALSS